MMSLEQCNSPFHNNVFHNNDDPINDISNPGVDNVCVEPYTSMRDTNFNNSIDDGGVIHSNICINNEDEGQCNISNNSIDNRHIPLMARSRRTISVYPLVSLAPILHSNIVAPDLVKSCNFDDIGVGRLFTEKNKLILKLRKVVSRDKFDFRITRSTMIRFEAHYSLELCKFE